MSVDEAEVRQVVLSFPTGSAGGPDGLRPQHIRDMLMCQEAGASSVLTDFVNLANSIPAGRCPMDIIGGHLLAFNKKAGGIRPIAIGFSLR